MHPEDCPEFEYSGHARRRQVLAAEVERALKRIRSGQIKTGAIAADTRPFHRRLFRELTPKGFDYFAGHYRGEDYRCLKHYPVRVRDDPRVGLPPDTVLLNMEDLRNLIRTSLVALDASHSLPDAQLPQAEKLVYTIAVACLVFVKMLTIHPYANGNGHAARFGIWAMLGRYDYWPERWPIEPRPPDPPYVDLIRAHRNGNPEPLEMFVLKCVAA